MLGLSMEHGTSYGIDHQFTNKDYCSITPEQVFCYMCVKEYGKELPNVSIAMST